MAHRPTFQRAGLHDPTQCRRHLRRPSKRVNCSQVEVCLPCCADSLSFASIISKAGGSQSAHVPHQAGGEYPDVEGTEAARGAIGAGAIGAVASASFCRRSRREATTTILAFTSGSPDCWLVPGTHYPSFDHAECMYESRM